MIIIQLEKHELEELIAAQINKALSKALLQPKAAGKDPWLNLTELCEYHPDKPSKQTVYGWISAGKIPYHKGGKKVSFLKSEIDAWLTTTRKRTNAELVLTADEMLGKKS